MGKRERPREAKKGGKSDWLSPASMAMVVVAVVAAGATFAMGGFESEGGDTDRISAKIEGIAPDDFTPMAGQALAKALDLRGHISDIVARYPGAELINKDPPIIHFRDFMSPAECDAIIEAGRPGLVASTGTGALKDGKFERTEIVGRTSFNSWCMGPCASKPVIARIDSRIANATGFSYKNMEYYQILRYDGPQEYQVHTDWIEQQKYQPSGPRVFTFFLYLNDVEESHGGATWFPQAEKNSTVNQHVLNQYYNEYNTPEGRKKMQRPAQQFADKGFRVQPRRGSAIMWPNVDLDNIFVQNPGTQHAAEELTEGSLKWSANAWIHLHDFRTPHAAGVTG